MAIKEYQKLSLREAAEYDHKLGLKDKLTGWGIICKERAAKGLSRRNRKPQPAQEAATQTIFDELAKEADHE